MANMYNNELISVIIPTYNSEKHIREALDSVIQQSYNDIEIIVIDDASKDNTKKIVEDYCAKDKRIISIFSPNNKGAGYTRNLGLEKSNGRYVAFLDSDDVWKKNKLSKQIEIMRKGSFPISYTAINIIDSNGKIIKKNRNIVSRCDYKLLLKNTTIATSSIVIDRKTIGEFRMSLRRSGQDYATWLKLLRDGAIAVGINEPLVSYRITSNSLSSNKFDSIRQVWEIQTIDEGINKFSALFNVMCFAFNAFKKHYL